VRLNSTVSLFHSNHVHTCANLLTLMERILKTYDFKLNFTKMNKCLYNIIFRNKVSFAIEVKTLIIYQHRVN
jgi:hypothetical protein